jgi:hypothetical protein
MPVVFGESRHRAKRDVASKPKAGNGGSMPLFFYGGDRTLRSKPQSKGRLRVLF